MGSMTPPVVFAIMRESGYPRLIGLLSACLIVFGKLALNLYKGSMAKPARLDNGHVVQDRLILLDASLLLFMSLAFYSYIRFYKLRYQ